MPEILTVSLNPALDSASDVTKVVADEKLRCVNAHLDPGGGGVNVSRAIRFLGGQSTAFVAVGGATGNMLVDLLNREDVDVARFDGPGLTRQNFAISELSTGRQFRFGQPGPDWTKNDVLRALAGISQLLSPDMLVIGSGSLPPGVRSNFYADLNRDVIAGGGRMVLDTSKEAMTAGLEASILPFHVLRMDRAESDELAGRVLNTLAEAAHFARSLIVRDKAEIVVLARGADGSLIVSGDDCFTCSPPRVQVSSKVGAGDSFVAALVLGLSNGWPLRRAAHFGTAAAAAACTTPASKLCQLVDVNRLLSQTETRDV